MNMLPATIVDDGGPTVLLTCGMRLKLAGALASAAAGHIGQAVAFGIRPENMKLVGPHVPDDWQRLNLPVDLVEGMGAENLVHFTLGGGTVVARVDAATRPREGATADVAFDPNAFHLFDVATDRAIRAD
jgi:multiple sugar transport system ATP-binding protein